MHKAFVAIGGNLIPEGYDTLQDVMDDALATIDALPDISVIRCSKWFETAPVPVSDQPWYLNAVFEVITPLEAKVLLAKLHEIEASFGRVRNIRNEARILDLDVIDYQGEIHDDETICLPHPRMHLRAFVLLPIQDLDPAWQHPIINKSVTQLIDEMPSGQDIRLKS